MRRFQPGGERFPICKSLVIHTCSSYRGDDPAADSASALRGRSRTARGAGSAMSRTGLRTPFAERQRRSVPKPRVGAQRQPWVTEGLKSSTPKGLGPCSEAKVYSQMYRSSQELLWRNPVGVANVSALIPKVAAARQPWALRRGPVGAHDSGWMCGIQVCNAMILRSWRSS